MVAERDASPNYHSKVDQLTEKQEAFVQAFCEGPTRGLSVPAAKVAGYARPNDSARDLLANKKIQQAVRERFGRGAMSEGEALRRLADYARNEGSNYIQPSGEVDLPRLLADGKAYLIKNVRYQGRYASKLVVDFYDAMEAMTLVLRAWGTLGAKGTEDDPVHMQFNKEAARNELAERFERLRNSGAIPESN